MELKLPIEKSKVALRLAYVGTAYAGFQTQPGRATVQAAVVEALRRARLFDEPRAAHFTASGRTDKGVHALDAVVAFETDVSELALPRHINTHLPAEFGRGRRGMCPSRSMPDGMLSARIPIILVPMGSSMYTLCVRQRTFLYGVHDFHNFSLEKRGRASGRSFLRACEYRATLSLWTSPQ